MKQSGLVLGLAVVAVIMAASGAAAAAAAQVPALIASPGLAPEGELVKLLCQRINLQVTYNALAEPKDLARFKSVMIIIGGSGKGLGAAGIDVQEEVKRGEGLLAEAKRLKIVIIGIHVGGPDRRGPTSAKFIELVTPQVNYLIVRADGNKDGIFTKLAKDNNIPLTVIQQTVEITDVLKKLYGI